MHTGFVILNGVPEFLPPAPGLSLQPRHGMSIAGILVGSAHNVKETVKRFSDCGVRSTRINLLSALWNGVDTLPFTRLSETVWDLDEWNPAYFDRLEDIRDRMNHAGIQIQWTNYELYSWSNRKPGPQQVFTPWRYNNNGIWWDPSDVTFGVLPDSWSKMWLEKVLPYLGKDNILEIGNEFPEKALHERVASIVRGAGSAISIQVNRNEDTPGQYANMKIGKHQIKPGLHPFTLDRIAFHGNKLKTLGDPKKGIPNDLDRDYPREPDYRTFRQFMDHCPHDPWRVVFSSDGARVSDSPVDTYDWDTQREWFREMIRRKYSIEHQSRAKMTPAPNHHMIETDWFTSVIR